MKKISAVLLVLCFAFSMVACSSSQSTQATPAAEATKQISSVGSDKANEEYVWISCLSSQSMFVNSDQAGLKKFAEDYGVKVSVVGPTDYDVAGQAAAIDSVVATKPAGIMVIGMESSPKESINNAVKAGIPVVTIDADVSDSDRLCFIGTDWYNLGVKHAEKVAELTGGTGKVAVIYQQGTETQEGALNGFKSVIAKYPGLKLIDAYSAQGSIETATQKTEDLITANPDIAAISCFDGSTPGVGIGIKEMNKAGKIIATGTNTEDTQLQQLKDGYLSAIIGQKRQLFSYYGGVVLYNYNHSTVSITSDDKAANILPIPENIDTGLFIVTSENVDSFLSKK